MKKAPGAAAGKKTNANTSSPSTMKRKETSDIDSQEQQPPPSSVLPKKGRYKDDSVAAAKSLKSTTSITSNGTSSNGTGGRAQPLPQNLVQFTFGELPPMNSDAFKATIVICKRTTLQQILSEGNQIFNAMLGLNLSTHILQSMFTDCGGGSSSSSKSIAVASTYVDHEALHISHHKLYFMTVPDTVSRCNHSWSVHAISDAVKSAVGGGGSSTSCRIVCCGTEVAHVMGSLTASIARAFSVYTRKTKKMTVMTEDVVSASPTVPRIHISFMDVGGSGVHEAIPTNNGDHLLYICESIQLTARLMDMVRVFYVNKTYIVQFFSSHLLTGTFLCFHLFGTNIYSPQKN